MMVLKIVTMTIALCVVCIASVSAIPIDNEQNHKELVMILEEPSSSNHLSEIKLATLTSREDSPTEFIPNVISFNTPAEFFRTLLSSLTYEIKFTSLGRLYTAIPQALHIKNHALFSSRLLPHPEKIQSTALLNNNKLVDFPKDTLPPQLQEASMFGPTFWLVMMSLMLIGTIAFVLWGSRRIIVLNI